MEEEVVDKGDFGGGVFEFVFEGCGEEEVGVGLFELFDADGGFGFVCEVVDAAGEVGEVFEDGEVEFWAAEAVGVSVL